MFPVNTLTEVSSEHALSVCRPHYAVGIQKSSGTGRFVFLCIFIWKKTSPGKSRDVFKFLRFEKSF